MENDEQQQEVFRGHLEECIGHLGRTIATNFPKYSKGSLKVKEPIAEFCQVQPCAVGRWFRGHCMPEGEPIIRLMCYLKMTGYKVIEFERMPKSYQGFCELIAFGIITPQEAIDLLDYKQFSQLSRALRGVFNITPEKDNKIWEAWKSRKDELAVKMEEAKKVYGTNINECAITQASQRKESPEEEAVGEGFATKQENFSNISVRETSNRRATISIMEGLLALLDESRPDEHDLVENASLILELSTHFNNFHATLIEISRKEATDG